MAENDRVEESTVENNIVEEENVVDAAPEMTEEEKLHNDPQFQARVQEIAEVFKNLLPIQREVNAEVQKKLGDKAPTAKDYVLAFNVELYELINEMGVWKWWKEHNQPNQERVLDELADCFAFMLSAFSVLPEEQLDTVLVTTSFRYWDLKVHLNPEADNIQMTKEICGLIGTASEMEGDQHLSTIESFALAIIAVEFLFKFEVDWDDFIYAYKKKSKVNIKRQKENY